jgi:hypothetical protein
MAKCIYCGYESDDKVHEYNDRGQKITACDDLKNCIDREVANIKERELEKCSKKS